MCCVVVYSGAVQHIRLQRDLFKYWDVYPIQSLLLNKTAMLQSVFRISTESCRRVLGVLGPPPSLMISAVSCVSLTSSAQVLVSSYDVQLSVHRSSLTTSVPSF